MASELTQDEFFSHFPNYILVAWRFKDNKAKGVNILHNISIEEANNMNTIKDKRDIYFTPNGDFKNIFKDSKRNEGRTEAKVKETGGNIYCFLGDNDWGETLRKDTWLTPTIINKTKRWYHMFFMLKNPVDYKTYANRRRATQQQLKELLKVDPADIARILRAPWYKYFSDNLWDITIETIEYNEKEVYTFEEREDRINILHENVCSDDVAKKALQKSFKRSKWLGKLIDIAFKDISEKVLAIDVLEDLYPKFTAQANGSILEDWKKTRWYHRHKSLNYVNNFSTDSRDERPAWWPWVIAARKHNSFEVTLDYFKNRWWILIDDMRASMWSAREISFTEIAISEELWVKKRVWNFWNNSEWITIDEKKMEIRWYTGEANDIPFVDALITPMGYIIMGDSTKTHVINIQKLWWEPRIVMLPLCSNLKEFRKFLMRYGIMIPEKAKFYIHVFDYIYKTNVPEYFYTNKLWLQELWWQRIIIEKTWEYIDEQKKIFVQILDTQEDKINVVDNNATFKEYMEKIIWGYGGRISIPVALTMILWVNAYYFRRAEMQLPQMFVFGLSQAGKTVMLNNIFRSFGINKDISAGSKAFVYEKYARHYIPTHFSEYRNSAHKQNETIEWFMRNLFDGSAIEKGRADQTTVKYEANWLYIFDGQTIFTDDAVLTRMIILMANNTDKLDLKNLKTLPNMYKISSDIFSKQLSFEKYMELVTPAFEDIKKRIKFTRNNDRMIQNYSYLYALCDYLWISEFKKYLDEAMQSQDGMTAQDDIQMIYSKIFNMQYTYKFPCEIFHKWILISASEEWLRFNTNIEDLKWFIKTINTNFLWTNTLSWLKLYVDLKYIYDHPGIRWEFFRALHTMYNLEDKNSFTVDERKTIWSLREFLLKNKPDHRLANDLNADLFDKWQPWKPTSTSSEIDFD